MSGEYGVPRFKVGDWVDAKRWDASEPKAKRLGVVKVKAVTVPAIGESGVCIQIESGEWFDQGWFVPADVTKGQFEI